MTVVIGEAGADDLDELVALEAGLFSEDAGVHDPAVDTRWPEKNGRDDFARLVADDRACVLIARDGQGAVGHLVGYLLEPTSVRPGHRVATIRSLFVAERARRHGAARELVERFTGWALAGDGVSAVSVMAYDGNAAARSLYEQLGFRVTSVVLTRDLP